MPSANAASSSVARRRVVDRRHDDQDAVGAPGARFRDLIGLEHEILAQRRQGGRGARGGQEFGLALERRRVGQHREAGRAARLIGARERRRIEVGADQALRRARLLDLGDQRVVAGRELALDRRAGSRAAAGAALAPRFDLGERARALGRGDLLALVGLDLLRGCRSWLRRSRRRSAGRAGLRPRRSRSTSRASATPSFRVLGLAGDHERRGGVEQRDVADTGPSCPRARRVSAAALVSASPPRSVLGLGARQADILGLDLEGA